MPYANLKAGHKLYYDEFGASAGEAIVLVMGLNTQCIAWDDDFCELLSNDKKYRVVRFDNRDIGLSDKFETKEKYNIAAAYFKQMLRMKIKAPYSLVDMSNDVFGLMDCLNIDRAHIVGASMGGMISQICALQNQSRVLSMTSIMSTTSAHNLPSARFSLIRLMLKPKPSDPKKMHKWAMNFLQAVIHPSNWNAEKTSQMINVFNERSVYNDRGRQLLAILSTAPRTKTLKNITVPSLVIHGAFDPLLVLEHGVATHKAIPGSSFLKIDTMGHDLPEKHWGDIVGAIHEVAAKGVVAAGGSNKSTVGDAGKTESGTDAVAKEVQPEVKTVQNSKIGENGSGSSMPEGPGRVVVTAQAI